MPLAYHIHTTQHSAAASAVASTGDGMPPAVDPTACVGTDAASVAVGIVLLLRFGISWH
jgi:hypothetical protein